jgi:imidazolonepropionase-like amidohydrolase
LFAALAGALSVAPLPTAARVSAQAPPALPDDYALTNARIITAPGQVIANGTVVVRDGRITAVGAQAAIPASAIRLDFSGLTVYPGLIDAFSSLGLPTDAATQAQHAVAPLRNAADLYAPGAADLSAVRNAGFTTAAIGFDGGIFPGRTAVVNTGDPAHAVLRTPVAQQVALNRRRGAYPSTLMGAIAFIKQSFLDAQYALRVQKAWDRTGAGPRPDYSPAVRGLEPAASGELPVWFDASTQRDIGHVIDLAKYIGVADYTIVGAQEGWLAIDALKRAGRPVIVSLDFPSPASITGRSFELNVAPPEGKDSVTIRADSAAARTARGNAAALARAGITFAFSGDGIPAKDLRARVCRPLLPQRTCAGGRTGCRHHERNSTDHLERHD